MDYIILVEHIHPVSLAKSDYKSHYEETGLMLMYAGTS